VKTRGIAPFQRNRHKRPRNRDSTGRVFYTLILNFSYISLLLKLLSIKTLYYAISFFTKTTWARDTASRPDLSHVLDGCACPDTSVGQSNFRRGQPGTTWNERTA